jgi:hypothetical protein
MATKDFSSKHPLFRQCNAEDVVEIVLMTGDGDEFATVPGTKSEQEIKLHAQSHGIAGPLNLLARLSNNMTAGPVQITVPSPRPSTSSLFRSNMFGASGVNNAQPSAPLPTQQRDPSLALDTVQRLDRLATDSVTTERARVDKERNYWQGVVESEKEQAKEREYAIQQKHENMLDESRRAMELKVQTTRETMDAKIDLLNKAHEASFTQAREREHEMTQRHADQIAEMKKAHDLLVRELRDSMETKVKSLTETYEKTLQQQKDTENHKIKSLVTDSGEKVSLVREMSDQTTRLLEQTNQQTITTLKSQLDASLQRIRDLETAREKEGDAAKQRFDDYRDRMTDEMNRLREEKSKVEQSRLELMLTSQKASSEEIRREIERVTSRHEAEVKEMKARFESDVKEQRRHTETLREKNEELQGRVRDESTKAEIALLREQATREPLKTERLIPILNALPIDQRAKIVGRAVASDLDFEYESEEPEEKKKPSLMDSIGPLLASLAQASMSGPSAAARPAPTAAPMQSSAPMGSPVAAAAAGAPVVGGGLGDTEEV